MLMALRCRGGCRLSEDGESVDVVQNIGEADFHSDPLDADGSDYQSAQAL